MVLTEQVEKSGKKLGIQIFATDSDAFRACDRPQRQLFEGGDRRDRRRPERLKRFFERKDGRYQVIKKIRERDRLRPAEPHGRPALLEAGPDQLQKPADLPRAGRAEEDHRPVSLRAAGRGLPVPRHGRDHRASGKTSFEPVSKKWRIYRRIGVGRPGGHRNPGPADEVAASPVDGKASPLRQPAPRLTLASAAQQMLLDRFAPACVMIDRKLQVLYVHGKVRGLPDLPPGELTTRIVDMAREGMRARLRGAIGKCLEMKRPVSVIGPRPARREIRTGEGHRQPHAASPGNRRAAAGDLRRPSLPARDPAEQPQGDATSSSSRMS